VSCSLEDPHDLGGDPIGTARVRRGTPQPASVSTLPPGKTTFRIAIGFE